MAITYRGAGEHVTAGTATSLTLPLPAGVAPGDLLIAMHHAAAGSVQTTWGASGWTYLPVAPPGANPSLITNGTDASPLRCGALWRIAGPGEPASVTLTKESGGSTVINGKVYAWSGVDATQPFDVLTRVEHPGGLGSTLDLPAQTSVTDGALAALLLLSVRAADALSGWTERSNTAAGNGNLSLQERVIPVAGTLDPAPITLVGAANRRLGFYAVLRPASGGPPPTRRRHPLAIVAG